MNEKHGDNRSVYFLFSFFFLSFLFSLAAFGGGFMAAQVAMNTTIAAATGGLVVFILRLAMTRRATKAFPSGS